MSVDGVESRKMVFGIIVWRVVVVVSAEAVRGK
jgi:hypothetical protein